MALYLAKLLILPTGACFQLEFLKYLSTGNIFSILTIGFGLQFHRGHLKKKLDCQKHVLRWYIVLLFHIESIEGTLDGNSVEE